MKYAWVDGRFLLGPPNSDSLDLMDRLGWSPGCNSALGYYRDNAVRVNGGSGIVPDDAELTYQVNDWLYASGRMRDYEDQIAQKMADGLKFIAPSGEPDKPTKLYHGTNVELRPGDEIHSSLAQGYETTFTTDEMPYYDPSWVYLSDQEHLAARYAIRRARQFGGTPHVYEVRPIGQLLPDPEQETGFSSDQWVAQMAEVIRELPFEEVSEPRYRQLLNQPLAATVEDTEPKYNFGFLKDPHKELYPCAWEHESMRPEAKQKIKGHALNALMDAGYDDADDWIYFTVYGSGASYNWDEDGDFDLQLWVDISKYNESHGHAPLSVDDLLADVRRVIQLVNFPSFADLGLDTPDCAGAMLIQYYPKAGTGSADENLAQRPYACYDMETDEWIVKPEPITSQFYGEGFMLVMPKAEDIAVQAESHLSELNRNIVNWQFWTAMFSKYNNPTYRQEAEDSRTKADQEKAGIANLFEGVFGGRQQAYSPEGKGINDERDILQKLLEVWGIFQDLKHYARAPLPWEEQDVPASPLPDQQMDRAQDRSSAITTRNDALAQILKLTLLGTRTPYPPEKTQAIAAIRRLMTQWGLTNEDFAAYAQSQGITRLYKTADWDDVQEKAQKYYYNGNVNVTVNNYDYVEGEVQGSQSQPYQTWFTRDDPNSGAITQWNCSCPWGQVSWGRTRQWKRYEGRPCAHQIALYWTSLKTPRTDGSDQQQQLPGMDQYVQPVGPRAPGYNPPGPGAFVQPSPQAPPSFSQPVEQGKGTGFQQLTIPGTLSKWKFAMAERSGDPTLDALIEEFKTQKIGPNWGRTPEDYRNPENALGQCYWASKQFERFLRSNGVKTIPIEDVFTDRLYPDWDKSGFNRHCVTQVQMPSGTYMVDWTASQYGYTEFPMVQKLDGDSWQREWQSRVAAFANGQLVKALVEMTGYDRDGLEHIVPRNTKGEILSSDDATSIAIFPLATGPLEPHLVRVESDTTNFSPIGGVSPFRPRRR